MKILDSLNKSVATINEADAHLESLDVEEINIVWQALCVLGHAAEVCEIAAKKLRASATAQKFSKECEK